MSFDSAVAAAVAIADANVVTSAAAKSVLMLVSAFCLAVSSAAISVAFAASEPVAREISAARFVVSV